MSSKTPAPRSPRRAALSIISGNPFVQPAESTYGAAVFDKVLTLLEDPGAYERASQDAALTEALAYSAAPGAQYLLATAADDYSLVLCGAPGAEGQISAAADRLGEQASFFHIRMLADQVNVSGVNRIRAEGMATQDWDLSLETRRARGAETKPLHVLRRQGYPVASGVVALHRPAGGTSVQLLVGGFSIAAQLTPIDQLRCWYILTTTAAAEVGRRPCARDQVVVNEVPAPVWLARLTMASAATMASWALLAQRRL